MRWRAGKAGSRRNVDANSFRCSLLAIRYSLFAHRQTGGDVASVELRGLSKRYDSVAAVDNVSLKIEHGLLVCLLGPSGCGKTTTLRLIAGFIEPSAGEIAVGDRVVSSPSRTVPPERRNMSMIFQSYALWPHMTVNENVAYGL